LSSSPPRKPVTPAKAGAMADDMMTLPKFAGVAGLLEKQEIGLSSTNGDACNDGCYADILVHGSQPSAG
jgi:hypothetical protein